MKVLVPLAEGFEEIEAVTVIDVLRRAGIDVVTAGIVSTVVDGAHKIRLMANNRLTEINPDDFDAIILPGGSPGYVNLSNSNRLISILKLFDHKNKLIGAICAAPCVLAKAGIIEDKRVTVYPGMENSIPRPRKANVIVDRNVVTSPGPATAMVFALKIVEILAGKQKADMLKKNLLFETEVF